MLISIQVINNKIISYKVNLYFFISSKIFTVTKVSLYSLDSSGGWELSGIRGMSLKGKVTGENSI